MTEARTIFIYITTVIALLVMSAFYNKAEAKQYRKLTRIAVIDSGFTPIPFSTSGLKLCKKGHFDFTEDKESIGVDMLGHGSYVTDLIENNADTKSICFIILKVFDGRGASKLEWIKSAMQRAKKYKAIAINMSLGIFQHDYELRQITKMITTRGIKIFASAGNSSNDLNEYCNTYPVCFKGINKNLVVVGALNVYGDPAKYSNKGIRVSVWRFGDIQNGGRGTSFAAPRALGTWIKSLKLDKE